jgi:hypothetical protein
VVVDIIMVVAVVERIDRVVREKLRFVRLADILNRVAYQPGIPTEI